MGRLRYIAVTFFLVTVMLLTGNRYVNAQNTGAGPYLNSWHTYRVMVGNAADTRQWDITNGTITRTLTGAEVWCDIAALAGGNADINICFTDSVFNVNETWFLRYREISSITGACTAARQFTILLTVNNFYLTLDADDQECKPESGQVFQWDQLENIAFPCTYSFVVTMHKEQPLTINHWAFDATVLATPTHTMSYVASVITPGGGVINMLTDGAPYGVANDGVFRVEVSAPTTATLQTVSIYVTVTFYGFVYQDVTAKLTLSNGIINSGSSGVTISPDNLSRPTALEEPVAALRDREQNVTFFALPATHEITVTP